MKAYVKELRVHNFKTYRSTRIKFSDGINVIIGRNGSGKSNILEAIAFGLGERSLKGFRANSFLDIVYNRRKDLQVSVTLVIIDENGDEHIFKRVFNPQKNIHKYYYNNKLVSRTSYLAKLASIGGGFHYVIIQQGGILSQANITAKDIKNVINEAFGLTQYDEKKKEAEQHLREAETKLSFYIEKQSILRSNLMKLLHQYLNYERKKNLTLLDNLYEAYMNILECNRLSNELKNIDLRIKEYEAKEKQLKEESMDEKISQRFLEKMEYLKAGLSISRRTKRIAAVHETVGRIKDQNSKVAKYYKITYQEDKQKGVITDIKWEKQEEKQRPKGEYFLRYSKEILTDKQIWDLYNLTREVEACFRFLKTDLNIRPIHHQVDEYIEPHIWLSIVAYQIAHYIRLKLKEKDIKYSWTTIVRKMQSQQVSIVSLNKKGHEKIFTKLVTRPDIDQQSIYDALRFKHRPFTRKTKVVPQL